MQVAEILLTIYFVPTSMWPRFDYIMLKF